MQVWLLQLRHTGNRNHLATNTMTEQDKQAEIRTRHQDAWGEDVHLPQSAWDAMGWLIAEVERLRVRLLVTECVLADALNEITDTATLTPQHHRDAKQVGQCSLLVSTRRLTR